MIGDHEPTLFGVDGPVDWRALHARAQAQGWLVHDAIGMQLTELLRVREPGRSWNANSLETAVNRHLDGRESAAYGTWVHYPWTNALVHVLPPQEYRELRLSRNRNKITVEEQARLLDARIAVVGLSVGFCIAQTLVLEGIGGELHLADFDTMCASNLNRVPATTRDLGVNKAVAAARRFYEIDPYLCIRVFPEGLTSDNTSAILDGGGTVDLLVEACDDLAFKIRLRSEARARRIPVIMDTNDRGMIDIERFDLEPKRPLLHGILEEIDPDTVATLTPAQRIDLVRRFLGHHTMSRRLAQSLDEIGVTLVSWPQLGSGTTLGAALATDAVRRILLQEIHCSGRFYVDPEQLIRD